MAKFSGSMIVKVTHNKAWRILSDFGGIHKFHPTVETSPIIHGDETGLGATRRCHFTDGSSVVERVIAWEEGRSYEVELSEFSMPFKSATARLSVAPSGLEKSVLTMEINAVVKYGPLGWLMANLMMRPMMKSMFKKTFRGLESHANTDQVINGKQMATSTDS